MIDARRAATATPATAATSEAIMRAKAIAGIFLGLILARCAQAHVQFEAV